MSDKVELYSTIKGNDVTMPTDDMKKDAWRAVAELGFVQKGRESNDAGQPIASLAYVPKLPAFVMSLENATPDAVASFRDAMAYHRTDAAQEAMVAELRVIQSALLPLQKQGFDLAGNREAISDHNERFSIALYPVSIPGAEGADPVQRRKSETAAMLTASDRVITDLGLKGEVKNSYDIKAGNWVVGGRGIALDMVRAIGDRLSDYQAPEAEAAWRANAPQKGVSAGKGVEDTAALSAFMSKSAGAEL